MKKRKTIKHKNQLFLKIIKGFFLIYLISIICFCLTIDLKEFFENFCIPMLVGLLVASELSALPFQFIYLFCKIIQHNNQKKNSTYIATHGFKYYRDKLKDIHPMQVSLLSNLKIEEEKDIKTMIMYYEHHNIIKVEGNKIEVIDDLNPLLKQSDRELLMRLTNPNLNNNIGYYEWKRIVKDEAISAKLVVKKGLGTALIKIFLISFLVPMVLALITTIPLEIVINKLDAGITIKTTQDLLNNIGFIITAILSALLGLAEIGLFLGGPVFIIVHLVSSSFLERTAKGNEVTEQIHGLKSFIHDFSTLGDATKQELVLWDDFLIYATILEENTKIIDEITAYKKL